MQFSFIILDIHTPTQPTTGRTYLSLYYVDTNGTYKSWDDNVCARSTSLKEKQQNHSNGYRTEPCTTFTHIRRHGECEAIIATAHRTYSVASATRASQIVEL